MTTKTFLVQKHVVQSVLLQDETINISCLLDDMNVPLIQQEAMLQDIAFVAHSTGTSTVPIIVVIGHGILIVKQQVDELSHDDDDTIMISGPTQYNMRHKAIT